MQTLAALKETLVLPVVSCGAVATFLCSGVMVLMSDDSFTNEFASPVCLNIKKRPSLGLGKSRLLITDKTVHPYFYLICILNCFVNF